VGQAIITAQTQLYRLITDCACLHTGLSGQLKDGDGPIDSNKKNPARTGLRPEKKSTIHQRKKTLKQGRQQKKASGGKTIQLKIKNIKVNLNLIR
jgi:hypothetical protein